MSIDGVHAEPLVRMMSLDGAPLARMMSVDETQATENGIDPVLGVSFSKRATWACLEMGIGPQNHNKNRCLIVVY